MGGQILVPARVERGPVVHPLLELVIVVRELDPRDVRTEHVRLARDVARILGLQPAGLAPHEVQDAAIVGIPLAKVADDRRIPLLQPRPQPLVRETRERKLVDVSVRRADQKRAPIGNRGVLGRRQVPHLDLARHAHERDPNGVCSLLRGL